MNLINFHSLKLEEFIDNLNPQNSGIFFSILLHLIILLFAVGLPNLFGPKDVFVPNVIPIEILNVSETTNIEQKNNQDQINKNTESKQKKFNASEVTEIQKVELKQKENSINLENQTNIQVKQKSNVIVEENSELTRGETVVDWLGVTKRPANCFVMNKANDEKFFQLLKDKLSLLP